MITSTSFRNLVTRNSSSSILSLLFTSTRFASSTSSSSSSSSNSYYDRLGISPSATTDEIKKVFKKKALACHPDIVQSSTTMTRAEKAKAEAEFRSIAEAYETLSNEQKRKKYDQQNRFSSTSTTTSTHEGKSSTKKSSAGVNRASYYSGPSSTTTRTTKKKSGSSSPFLSKDAQRVFKEAFEGKSVHDVLFANAYNSKYGGTLSSAKKSKSTTTTTKLEKDRDVAADTTTTPEMWQKFMNGTKEELAKQFKEKHPYADPKDYAFGLRKSFHLTPEEAPSSKFPFRPCANLRLPDHVHPGDEVQTLEPQKINFDADQVDRVSFEPASGFQNGQDERGEFEKLDDPDEYQRTMRNYRLPTNEGMVWSMRRKY